MVGSDSETSGRASTTRSNYVSKSSFDSLKEDLKTLKSDIVEEITSEISRLIDEKLSKIIGEKLDQLENKISENFDEIVTLKHEIEQLKSVSVSQYEQIEELKATVEGLSDAANTSAAKTSKNIRKIEEQIESRTNRQLRKTLVIKGIQELNKNQDETWTETR